MPQKLFTGFSWWVSFADGRLSYCFGNEGFLETGGISNREPLTTNE